MISDLNLYANGLQIIKRPISNYLPLPDGDAFIAWPDNKRLSAEIARFSHQDADHYPHYADEMATLAGPIKDLMLETPPLVNKGGLSDILRIIQASRKFRQFDGQLKQRLLKLFTVSAGEWLDDEFEASPLKAWMGFDAIVGNYQSPYSPGSAYVMLHHMLGEVDGEQGIWGHAVGGMGAITQAIAREAQARGVEIITDCTVDQLEISKGKASGVRLANGDSLHADSIASNVNPRLLFLGMLDPDHLSPATLRHFKQHKNASGSFRMNVALSELPAFPHRNAADCLGAGIIMAPSLKYMERAYVDARETGYSRQPVVEMLIPSITDDSLAPDGQHVASLFCQQFDPTLDWTAYRDAAIDSIVNLVTQYAPNFRDSIVGSQAFSPLDLETRFGLTGGDIFHGRMSLEQLYSARPMLGIGQYQTEIPNVFMCGAGTHPGGGVSGVPGRNAAKQMIRVLA